MLRRIIFLLVFAANASLAAPEDIGQIGSGLSSVFENAAHGMQAICLTVGIGLIAMSLMKYKEHRDNPSEIGWGTVLLYLFLGLAFAALFFIPRES